MSKHLRRPSENTLGARVGYRIDRFLGLHPVVQLFAVLSATLVLALIFGCAIAILDRAAQPSQVCETQTNCPTGTVAGGLWWAITRMLDGGTVSSDTGSGLLRQWFGLGVTIVGMVAVTVLTGAFASSFSERLAAIRRGTLPVFERDHVLLLGWNAHAGVVLRELARSGERMRLVIVADHERELIEESIREQIEGFSHRLTVVVRRGDPTTAAAIRRASARRARAVLILPDTESVRCADRAALRLLLALERVLGSAERRPQVIVEVASPNGGSMVDLCQVGGAAARRDLVIVQAYEANARVVAQAVRNRGAFAIVRQVLALDSVAIYVYGATGFEGLTFDHAHFELASGVLIGLVREGEPLISPDGELTIDASDQLLVLNDRDVAPRARQGAPPHRAWRVRAASDDAAEPLRVLVLRYRSELCAILDYLDNRGPVHATLLATAPEIARARTAFARARLAGTTIELIEGDPTDPAAIDGALEQPHDVALLLAPDVPSANLPEADADQLISLLQLRRQRHDSTIAPPEHAVIEVRSPETRLPKQLSHQDDFILSREIVGLLIARELHALAFGGISTYHAVLQAFSPSVELCPMERYAAGHERPTFGDLRAAARRRGEVAIGVALDRDRPRLFPALEESFVAKGSRLALLRPRARLGVRPIEPPSERF